MSTATLGTVSTGNPTDPGSIPAVRKAGATDADLSQLVSFRLANEEYGVDIMHVQEIILIGQITEMANVPEYIRGLINLRGHVIPIVDLRLRFELPRTERTEDSRIIVLNVHKQTIGIIVDSVNEVLRIHPEQVESASLGVTGMGDQYVSGLVKFETKLLILLNVEQILAEEQAIANG